MKKHKTQRYTDGIEGRICLSVSILLNSTSLVSGRYFDHYHSLIKTMQMGHLMCGT